MLAGLDATAVTGASAILIKRVRVGPSLLWVHQLLDLGWLGSCSEQP